jgi:hypothetical protein
MDTTPDTLNYLIAGYTVFAIVMVSYLASLYIRWRNLEREQHTLDEIARK